MLWHVSVLPSFICLKNIPLCVYTIMCLFIHLLVDTCIFPHFGAVVKSVAMNVCARGFVWVSAQEWNRQVITIILRLTF